MGAHVHVTACSLRGEPREHVANPWQRRRHRVDHAALPTALLVIDVQQSFTRRPYFSAQGMAPFLAAQNALIQGAQERGLPIVRVFHGHAHSDSSDPFSRSSGMVRPLEGLADFEAAFTTYKTRHSALVGTGLDVWLLERGLRRIIVSGIRTEQCCETTTHHASDLGWQVLFVPQATPIWDYRLAAAQTLAALGQGASAAPLVLEQFHQAMAADDVNDIFSHALLLVNLGDARARAVFPVLRDKFASDANALEAAKQLEEQLQAKLK